MDKTESYFQPYMEIYLRGTHMKLDTGISDITNDKMHAELKTWSNWKSGMGQLFAYVFSAYREELHIYFFGPSPKNKNLYIKALLSYNIQPFEMILNDTGFDLINLKNNKTIHTFIDKSIMKLLKEPIIEYLDKSIIKLIETPIEENVLNIIDKPIIDIKQIEEYHICPRCGYETNRLGNYKTHLERKNICKPIIKEIDLDEIRIKFAKVKILFHECKDCGIELYSKSTYYTHIKECMKNQIINKMNSIHPPKKFNFTNNFEINTDTNFIIKCLNKGLDGLCNFFD